MTWLAGAPIRARDDEWVEELLEAVRLDAEGRIGSAFIRRMAYLQLGQLKVAPQTPLPRFAMNAVTTTSIWNEEKHNKTPYR